MEIARKRYNEFRKATIMDQNKMIAQVINGYKYDTLSDEIYTHMSKNECVDILSQGHSIQSHSVTHNIMSCLEDDESENEIIQSKELLENALNTTVDCFAYPFGDPKYDFSQREAKYLKKHNYVLGFQGEWTTPNGVTKDIDSYMIPRFGDVNRELSYFKFLISSFRFK